MSTYLLSTHCGINQMPIELEIHIKGVLGRSILGLSLHGQDASVSYSFGYFSVWS